MRLPVDPRDLDVFTLEGPVGLAEAVALDAALRELWPGAAGYEVRVLPGDALAVAVWWDDYHTGPIVRRTLRAP